MTQEDRWYKRYQEVIAFIVKEHRKPSKYYPEKKLLFHFIHHNKKLYNAGSMKPKGRNSLKSCWRCVRSIKVIINMYR